MASSASASAQAAVTEPASPAETFSVGRRILILVMVVMATTLYGTTLLVVSTILPQMQGSFAATADEIAWAMTFNILATAIVTPMSGWLAGRFGGPPGHGVVAAGFTVSTFMCGAAKFARRSRLLAHSAGRLRRAVDAAHAVDPAYRLPAQPAGRVTWDFRLRRCARSDLRPRRRRHHGRKLLNWRWAFYALVPVGIARHHRPAAGAAGRQLQDRSPLDWVGFVALSIALAACSSCSSRGQRLDWFDSDEIIIETIVAVIAFWIFATHCLTSAAAVSQSGLLLDRNYALGLMLVAIYGMLNFTPMVLLPPLLQQLPASPTGLSASRRRARRRRLHRLLRGDFVGRLDGRIGMIVGFGLQVFSGVWLMHIDLNVTPATPCNAGLQGVAIGVIWVPLTIATFATLPGQARRGDRRLSSAAQYRLDVLHLVLRRRDRARHEHELQPPGRDGERLQQRRCCCPG